MASQVTDRGQRPLLAMFPAMEHVIDVLAASQIDRLEPLWAQLLTHHSQQAAHLAALGAVRPPRDSWRLRRGQYLGWLQEPSTRVLAARDGDRLLGYAAVRVLEAPGSWQWGDRVGVLETLVVDDEARGGGAGQSSSPPRASISTNWASR